MVLRAGEIEQCGAEAFLVEQADIYLEIIREQEAYFVFAVSQRLFDARKFQNVLGYGFDILGLVVAGAHGDQQIEIADGFFEAAERAGGGDFFDGFAGGEDVLAEFFSDGVAGAD